MIFSNGQFFEREDEVLDGLPHAIEQALEGPELHPEFTISAYDRLAKRAQAGEFDSLIETLDLDPPLREAQIQSAIQLLCRESLEAMLEVQLGKQPFTPHSVSPPFASRRLIKRRRPLGVLFHIAAGNMDGLPVFTVVEGLLTGNINLLKLPSVDNGVSVRLLHELVLEEPRLAPFIHVFDTPSEDLTVLQRLASLADGIVVWGGAGAVSSVRALAPVGAKLIEWGHRLSFAYITREGEREEELAGLARHIMQTKQLLCSSCQTIFLDREQSEMHAFAERFLPILEREAARYPVRDMGALANVTLNRMTERMEHAAGYRTKTVLVGKGCSLTLGEDDRLEVSLQYGNPLIKCLPRERLIQALRPYRGVLQTAGLLCGAGEQQELTELLFRAGVVRVTKGARMSQGSCCDAHDGAYPLERYTRVVEYEERPE